MRSRPSPRSIPETLTKAIENAEPDAVVPAITLREEDFAPVETELRAVPGIQLAGRETPLTPTRDFARALLGTVGPATAEQVKKSDGELDADDIVGQSGLSAAFDEQLAGEPERSVVIRNAEGEAVETLETHEGEPGEPLETTLSAEVQTAAEDAFADVEGAAALVALDPKTGDILAVANRPTDEGTNIAFTGQYPPGSTFKVVSTAALLDTGLETTEIVDCPESIDVGGREFVNFEGSAAGAVPFSTDFAQSCNTAFVSLADELEPTDLRDKGEQFGVGIDPELPLDAFGGDIPPGKDEVEEAASVIGQGRILVSPLVMAGVAATVQSRRVAQAPARRRRPRGGRRADRPAERERAANADALRGDVGHRHRAGRCSGRADRQVGHGRVRHRRPAEDPRLVHRGARRRRCRGPRRRRHLRRRGRGADRARAS